MPEAGARPGERAAGVVAWGAVVAAVALIVVMLATDGDEQPADTATRTIPAEARTESPVRQREPMRPGPEPGGAPKALAAAEQILDAYNQRDSAPLRAWACDHTTVSDDLFDGFSATVTFATSGDPDVIGFDAEVPFLVQDDGRQRAGAMRLRWDGNRWCFVTAVAKPD